MTKTDIVMSCIASFVAGATLVFAAFYFTTLPAAETYALQVHYLPTGEFSTVDHDLSFLDCFEERQEQQRLWSHVVEVKYTCEREI